jgi:hypothetical protein
LTIAEAIISVKLDTTAYKKQLRELDAASPAQAKASKAQVDGLKKELALKKSLDKLDELKKKNLIAFGSMANKAALAAGAGIGTALAKFMKVTDPAAAKLNATVQRLKMSFFQLFANIGMQANAKFGITDKLERLNTFVKNLSKADINAFLDTAKLALFVAGFTKMLIMASQIGSNISKWQVANAAVANSSMALAAGAGAGVGGRASRVVARRVVTPWVPSWEPSATAVNVPSRVAVPVVSTAAKGAGGASAAGFAAVAMITLGAAFKNLGDGATAAEQVVSGLNRALGFLSKVFFSIITVVSSLTTVIGDMIGSIMAPIFDLIVAIKLAIMGEWKAALDYMTVVKEDLWDVVDGIQTSHWYFTDKIDKLQEELGKIWNPFEGGQEKLGQFGSASTVGIPDLNKAFQDFYNQNAELDLADSTKKNTEVTQANTETLAGLIKVLESGGLMKPPSESLGMGSMSGNPIGDSAWMTLGNAMPTGLVGTLNR